MTDTPNSRRDLWRAVIKQAVADAISPSMNITAVLDRRRARTWLSSSTADFAQVCALADYEPDQVRRQAAAIIARADNGEPIEAPKAKPAPALPPARRLRPKLDAPPKRFRRGRKAERYTHDGQTFTAAEWARRLGISPPALRHRLRSGWPLARALTEPISEHARNHRDSLKRNRELMQG